MSRLGASLFAWIQGAPFYEDAHAEAVALLPPGEGRSWLDVGCGPGLVARLAAHRGYEACGVDADPHMIAAARRGPHQPGARFEVSDLAAISRQQADVVSAASLLFVLPDARLGAAQLWSAVRPGGHLLIVETTAQMTRAHARAVAPHLSRRRRSALALWAAVRGGRTFDGAAVAGLAGAELRRVPLLRGLLEAWVVRKDGASLNVPARSAGVALP